MGVYVGLLLILWPVWALAAFVHPSLLNTNAELTYIAAQVNAGQNPWKFAYDRMPRQYQLCAAHRNTPGHQPRRRADAGHGW